jgi:hypothetical protein
MVDLQAILLQWTPCRILAETVDTMPSSMSSCFCTMYSLIFSTIKQLHASMPRAGKKGFLVNTPLA